MIILAKLTTMERQYENRSTNENSLDCYNVSMPYHVFCSMPSCHLSHGTQIRFRIFDRTNKMFWISIKHRKKLPAIFSHICSYIPISKIPKCNWQISHDAPFHNKSVNMCVHISVSKWCIVGYGTGASYNETNALWHVCHRFISLSITLCTICQMVMFVTVTLSYASLTHWKQFFPIILLINNPIFYVFIQSKIITNINLPQYRIIYT